MDFQPRKRRYTVIYVPPQQFGMNAHESHPLLCYVCTLAGLGEGVLVKIQPITSSVSFLSVPSV